MDDRDENELVEVHNVASSDIAARKSYSQPTGVEANNAAKYGKE